MDIRTANRLQLLRKNNGYSQDALAEQLGISRQAISKWERAESSPDTDNLIALAELYNMTLDDLLNSENDTTIIETDSDKDEKDSWLKRPSLYGDLGKTLLKFPFPLIVVIIYLAFGFVLNMWHPTWLIFMVLPVYYHFAGAAYLAKTQKEFLLAQPLPEVIVTIYLILGIIFGLWNPSWIIFLLIPVYYWAVASYMKNSENKD